MKCNSRVIMKNMQFDLQFQTFLYLMKLNRLYYDTNKAAKNNTTTTEIQYISLLCYFALYRPQCKIINKREVLILMTSSNKHNYGSDAIKIMVPFII